MAYLSPISVFRPAGNWAMAETIYLNSNFFILRPQITPIVRSFLAMGNVVTKVKIND